MPIASGASGGAALAGVSQLIYRFTISGADKASIDTGADASQAGTNDWTNGDVLEVAITAQTDDAAIFSFFDMTINNDTSASYDWYTNFVNGAALAISSGFADTKWQIRSHGTTGVAYPAVHDFVFTAFTTTTFKKAGTGSAGLIEASTGNAIVGTYALGNRNTTAITRVKIAGQAAAKLKVGSSLAIYKRTAT